MKNYRNAETKEEMLQNIEEMTELLGRKLGRQAKFLQMDLRKYPASSRIDEYVEVVDGWVRSYAVKLYEDENIGMAEMKERIYNEMGVKTQRANYNNAVLEIVE